MGNCSAPDPDELLAERGLGGAGAPTGLAAPGAAAALVGGVLLIGAVLAGNSLVCVSVAAERALQTPTNYFIVSLAAADLLLALLVLPLFVYSEPRTPQRGDFGSPATHPPPSAGFHSGEPAGQAGRSRLTPAGSPGPQRHTSLHSPQPRVTRNTH